VEQIDAGCEALTLLFASLDPVSDEKKARAVILLEKLLFRHESAQMYVRRNMETMVGQCVTRSLRRGSYYQPMIVSCVIMLHRRAKFRAAGFVLCTSFVT
jgi:hypothetical protein